MKSLVRIGAALTACAVLAACSSSSKSGGSSSSAPAGGSSSSGGESSGLAAAQKLIDTYSKSPTAAEIGVPGGAALTPLSKKPDPGKLVVVISPANPSSVNTALGVQAATQALGWSYKNIVPGNGPQAEQDAFASALQLSPKPYAIHLNAFPKVDYTAQLAQAKAAGIYVSVDNILDPPRTGDGIEDNINPGASSKLLEQEIVAALAVTVQGKATKVLEVNVPAFPILTLTTKEFKDALAEYCPACSTTQYDAQLTEVGTTLPQAVVSKIQADPSIKYVEIDGALSQGIAAALKSAGLKVPLIGVDAQPDILQALRNNDGTWLATTGYAQALVGWEIVDAIARKANGDPPQPLGVASPTQLVWAQNAKSILLDSNGLYIGIPDYQAHFKQLWHVS